MLLFKFGCLSANFAVFWQLLFKLLWNCRPEFCETWQEARTQHPLPSTKFSFFGPIGNKDGHHDLWLTLNTVDGFIFVGTNCRGLNENDTFLGFKICGHSIFLHISYRKCEFMGTGICGSDPLHENHENWYPTKIKPSTVLSVQRLDFNFITFSWSWFAC